MLVETDLGAATVVANQAVIAARPDTPDRLTVTAPPDPRSLKDSVASDLNSLFLALAGVALVIGAVGIANTMLVAVMERVPEIGLRRSLGAGRGHVAFQFISESSTIGLVGGILGAAAGIATVVGVAAAGQWTPLLEPWSVSLSPLLGALTGPLAGLYPAYRASRVEPADALRR
jgi:putative ABC transport system permease protein